MEKFVILPDVNCDLSPEICAEIGLNDYVPGFVHFSDGRDFNTSMDWETISRTDFYNALSDRKLQVSTAPMNPEGYYQHFRKYVNAGYKIISISLSSKISSAYQVAYGAAQRVMEEVPGSEIYCVDSFRMSSAIGLLVIYAMEMQREGKTFREIIDWLESNKTRVHQMGPIDDLMFIARRGRISTGKAIMGSFAGVKPMGDCNSDGYVTVLTKVKGIKKALNVTVEYVKATATDIKENYVIICHSDREQYANTLKELVEQELCPKKVFLTDVFDSCGTNIGPGMIGVYYLGSEVTQDLEAEKQIINTILDK